MFAGEDETLPPTIARRAYCRLRRALRDVGFLRRGWYFILVLKECIRDPWRSVDAFEREFERQEDPWGYTTRPFEQERHRLALRMLNTVRGEAPFSQVLEVGCAEGAFTKLLAGSCDSLLAVDFSPLALARARERCYGEKHVRFEQWDLRCDPLQGTFEVIVVMDVLSCFLRPSALRAACSKLLDGIRPGGYLLLGDVRQSEVFEAAWWGRWLIRGGKWILTIMAQYPPLKVVTTATTDTHVFALFRKAGEP